MRHHLTALLLAVLALSGVVGAVSAEQRTLTVVADDWPPFSGSALPNGGMSLDVISTVLQRAGYKVETQVVPWARIMSGARSGEFDVIGSLFEDADMKKFVSYGDPFFSTDVRLVQPAGGTHRFTSVAALRPFSIAVGDGFVYQDEFDRADYLNKIVVTTALQAIKMVAFGRADLTLDSADVVRHAIQNDDPTLSARVEFAPGVLVSQNIHMAVNSALPDSADIVADFNRVLAEMKADGSLDALLAVHVGQQGTE